MRKVPNTIWTRAENGQNRNPKNSFTLPLESTKNNLLGRKGTRPAYETIVNSSTGIAPKSFRTLVLEYTSESLEQQQDSCPRYAKHKPEKLSHRTAARFVLKVCKTQARKTLSRYLSYPKKFFWAARAHAQPINPSSSPPKHAAKLSRNLALEHRFRKPRTQQNTSRSLRCEKSQTPSGHEPKTAKTRSKKLFHVTVGIHQKQSFGPREIWPWNTASESLEQQNTSGSLRCEKSQTPSGHEPKTAKTWSKKLFHVTFGIHQKQSFGPQGHMPSLSNHRQFLHWNRSEIVSNSGLGIHVRKPRTAARFVPKSCETAARKSA